MILAVVLILGFIMGYVVASFVSNDKEQTLGTVHIVDEDGTPYLYLNLNDEIECLYGKKYGTFEINDQMHHSQK